MNSKGQMGLMEYIILTFFISVVIVVLIFFLLGFQVSQLSLEQRSNQIDRALVLTRQVTASPFLVKEEGVFDDAKLTSLLSLRNVCSDLKHFFDGEWFFELSPADGSFPIQCSISNYPNCNSWSFCTKQNENVIAFDIPVNLYRNIGSISSTGVLPRTELAVLKVGIYAP